MTFRRGLAAEQFTKPTLATWVALSGTSHGDVVITIITLRISLSITLGNYRVTSSDDIKTTNHHYVLILYARDLKFTSTVNKPICEPNLVHVNMSTTYKGCELDRHQRHVQKWKDASKKGSSHHHLNLIPTGDHDRELAFLKFFPYGSSVDLQ